VGFSDEPEANLSYTYRLEGAESGWQGPGTEHDLNYAELTPGHYRFLVKAINSEGLESADAAQIEFVILPPFWRRWWFLTVLGLLGAGLIYGLHLFRVSRLVELERVRTRIATDLHDDVGANLSRMAILSEVVKTQLAPSNENARRLLADIADTSRGLVDEMSDIVWSIDPRHGDLLSVAYRLREFGSTVLGSQGIGWDLRGPAKAENLQLTPEQRRHIFLILKEAIHNVAQHAECSTVEGAISVEDNQIRAHINDNGRGFPRNASGSGHGLQNMTARAAELGGTCEIESEPGRGTRIRLKVPAR
jgi:hypothetical protein